MNRISSYIIGSRVGDGRAILIHGYSGAIDLVDDAILDFFETNKTIELLDNGTLDSDIYANLCERGYITSKTEGEEREYAFRLSKALQKRSKITGANFTIVVTYDCNLCCPYCFEKEYAWKLKRHTLDIDTVDKIYSTIDDILSKTSKASKNITLFGGEPLLKKNLPIVEYIVAEGRKRGLKFSAITNGVELDSFIHLIDKDQIGHLQITMDGVGETHDRTRRHREGIQTFDTIIRNIRLALDKGISISVRFNADKDNYGDFAKLERYFSECGYYEYPKFRASMSRTVNYDVGDKDDKFFTQKEFISQFIDNDEKGGRIQDFSAYRLLSNAIQKQKPIEYKGSFCSSQLNGYVFDPMCRVFPCWEVIGDERNCIGNFSNGVFEPADDGINIWHNSNSYQTVCLKCPALLLCGGGCFAKNLHAFKCIQMPEIIKHNASKIYRELLSEKYD